MKPEVKKWLIVGALGTVSVVLALGYLQYKKLMNYVIKVSGVKVKALTSKAFDFDLILNYTNKSDVKFTISEQQYKVYLNDKFVTKLTNFGDVLISPKSDSLLAINVKFDPSEVLNLLGKNAITILLSPEKTVIKVDIKLKVSMYGIKVSIPYEYVATLKEMMTPAKA